MSLCVLTQRSSLGFKTRKQPAASVSAVTLRFHPQLWSCFSAQDWPEKELILIESTKATSKRTETNQDDAARCAAATDRPLVVFGEQKKGKFFPQPLGKTTLCQVKRALCSFQLTAINDERNGHATDGCPEVVVHPALWLFHLSQAGSRSSPRARSPDFSSLAAEDERILYVQSTPQ